MFIKYLKNKRNVFSIITLILIAIVLTGCGSNNKQAKVNAVGSTALQPLVEQLGNDYQLSHKGVSINVQGGGSGTGLSQLQEGAVSIGNSDVFAQKQSGIDANKMQDNQVAVAGVAPVINKKSKVNNLSMEQLRDIFTGKITNWKQVGGKDQPIIVINRAKGSGIRSTFETAVLNGKDPMNTQEQDSNGTVRQIVSSTPGAISYLSFSFLNVDNLKPVSIDGIQPKAQNIEDNKWKLWSYEHMYTSNKPSEATAKFIDHVKSEKIQKSVVQELGYVSIHNMKVQKDADGNVTKK